MISIHALRVEGDAAVPYYPGKLRISIHALRVEGDNNARVGLPLKNAFLSTPSGWRATHVED